MASKRRRGVSSTDIQLIEIYDDLANENEEIRLRAAHMLLSKHAQPDSCSHQKLTGILKRLFRGLCSSRKAARVGFSIALTEFLAQIFQHPLKETGLSHKDVLEILDKQSVLEGSTSGQVCYVRKNGLTILTISRMSEITISAGCLVLRPLSTHAFSSNLNLPCNYGEICCSSPVTSRLRSNGCDKNVAGCFSRRSAIFDPRTWKQNLQ